MIAPTVIAAEDFQAPPIAQMPPWHFWCRDLIGASEEDFDNYKRGVLHPKRAEELAVLGIQARDALAQMPVPGFQDWMIELRRRLN